MITNKDIAIARQLSELIGDVDENKTYTYFFDSGGNLRIEGEPVPFIDILGRYRQPIQTFKYLIKGSRILQLTKCLKSKIDNNE